MMKIDIVNETDMKFTKIPQIDIEDLIELLQTLKKLPAGKFLQLDLSQVKDSDGKDYKARKALSQIFTMLGFGTRNRKGKLLVFQII